MARRWSRRALLAGAGTVALGAAVGGSMMRNPSDGRPLTLYTFGDSK